MVNLSFQIFNKTGTSLFGPANNNTVWAGFGGPCQNENSGDPVTLYDQLSDRWFLSQFTSAGPNYFFCVAISQTPDPLGPYYRYAISTGTRFPDYPKAAVWPDAYYVSTREFAGAAFAGVGAYALNRAQAVAGNPAAQVISFLAPPGGTPYNVGDGLLPSDLDGPTLPPAGSPNYFVGSMDNNGPYGAPQDALTLWKFTANFATPAGFQPSFWRIPSPWPRSTPSWVSAAALAPVSRSRARPAESITWAIGNAQRSVWPTGTMAPTNRSSPTNPFLPEGLRR